MKVFEENKVGRTTIDSSMDTVVIRQYIGGLTGGRALDYSKYDGDVIHSGHLIVKQTIEGEEVYSPLEVDENKAYKALTEGQAYAGVVVSSKLKGQAVAIMDNGRVNDAATPYPITEEMRTKLKTALPQLIFEHD